jgi:hypothetical protein
LITLRQGLDVDAHDIDVDTSAAAAYYIEHQCRDLVVRTVQFVVSRQIRSHWGALIDGVQVELIGEFQVVRGDGSWTPPPGVRQLRRFVALDDLHLPVMPLEYVRDWYRLMGKTDKAAIIDR